MRLALAMILAAAAATLGGSARAQDDPPPVDLGAYVEPSAPAVPPRAQREHRWITHTVLPNEKLEQIAARYGATSASVRGSNDLDKPLRSGRRLRVYAARVPAPRVAVDYTVEPGDSWVSIATAHRVRYRDLRGWNWQARRLRPGVHLTIWTEPDRPRTVYQRKGPRLPAITVRAGALSRGRPQRGSIDDAVRLPPSHLYTLKSPRTSWGSTHAVRIVLEAIARFRHEAGFAGELIIGSMSRRRGGRFRPHASHRSGRDIDIFLPLLPHIPFTWTPNPFEVDWEAAWALIRAFDASGEVEAVFLDTRVQRFLYEAGRHLGATEAELTRLVQFPRTVTQGRDAIVRHGADHTRHFHIRLTCAADEPRCYSHLGDERWAVIDKADRRRGR